MAAQQTAGSLPTTRRVELGDTITFPNGQVGTVVRIYRWAHVPEGEVVTFVAGYGLKSAPLLSGLRRTEYPLEVRAFLFATARRDYREQMAAAHSRWIKVDPCQDWGTWEGVGCRLTTDLAFEAAVIRTEIGGLLAWQDGAR